MIQLTRVELEIINAIARAGGQFVSLFRLADLLDLDYSNAHLRLSVLELIGLIEIDRQAGRPLVIKLTTDLSIPDPIPAEPPTATTPSREQNGLGTFQTD